MEAHSTYITLLYSTEEPPGEEITAAAEWKGGSGDEGGASRGRYYG